MAHPWETQAPGACPCDGAPASTGTGSLSRGNSVADTDELYVCRLCSEDTDGTDDVTIRNGRAAHKRCHNAEHCYQQLQKNSPGLREAYAKIMAVGPEKMAGILKCLTVQNGETKQRAPSSPSRSTTASPAPAPF